ncbi:MAG: hypothetical protein LBH01_01035 [Verrucomicrobiales bacterium]|jgi:hypothetical protein|nr:hypothetical protein [Verrucomicrobiales bacterium]
MNNHHQETPVVELAVTTGQSPREGVGRGQRLQITDRGIVFNGKMSLDQWRDLLASLQQVKNRFHVYLADAIVYGREHFGERKVGEILDQMQFDYADCSRAMHIGQIELDLRLPELTAEHLCVLGMELQNNRKMQAKWVKLALQHGLTPLELRKSIQAGKVLRQEAVDELSGRDAGITTIEGVRFSFDRWKKQVGGEEAVLGWDVENKRLWLQQVEPIIILAEKVKATLQPQAVS